MHTLFIPENLRAGAVKGLIQSLQSFLFYFIFLKALLVIIESSAFGLAVRR